MNHFFGTHFSEKPKKSQVIMWWTGPDSDRRPSALHFVQDFATLNTSSTRLTIRLCERLSLRLGAALHGEFSALTYFLN
jgi:hypothetical protein